MADTTVKVTFLGDAKDLNRAIGEVDDKMGKASGKISAKTKAAAAGGILALGTGLFKAGEAAAEDEAASTSLAKTLENVTGATKEQIRAVEKHIQKTSLATGVMDDELRPAFDSLVRATGSTEQAQKLLGLAMDVSAGTGKDLGSVTDALGKAYNGNEKAIKALSPELTQMIKDGASADEVFATLGSTFAGQTQAATETAAGKMAILKVRLAEATEELGAKLIPIALKFSDWLLVTAIPAIEKFSHWVRDEMIPQLQDMWRWFDRNIVPVLERTWEVIVKILDIGSRIAQFLAEATILFWRFASEVKDTVDGIIKVFAGIAEAIFAPFKWAFNEIAKLWNNTVGKLSFSIPGWVPGIGGHGWDVPDIPIMHNGGVFNSGRGQGLALLQDGERVLPAGSNGGGGIVVNNYSADPDAVVFALKRYEKRNGPGWRGG